MAMRALDSARLAAIRTSSIPAPAIGEGDAAAERGGERAAAEHGGGEAPGLDGVEEPEGAAVEALGDHALEQHAVAEA